MVEAFWFAQRDLANFIDIGDKHIAVKSSQRSIPERRLLGLAKSWSHCLPRKEAEKRSILHARNEFNGCGAAMCLETTEKTFLANPRRFAKETQGRRASVLVFLLHQHNPACQAARLAALLLGAIVPREAEGLGRPRQLLKQGRSSE